MDRDGKNSVIDILPEQEGVKDMGATMRLGDHEVMISGGKLKNYMEVILSMKGIVTGMK